MHRSPFLEVMKSRENHVEGKECQCCVHDKVPLAPLSLSETVSLDADEECSDVTVYPQPENALLSSRAEH